MRKSSSGGEDPLVKAARKRFEARISELEKALKSAKRKAQDANHATTDFIDTRYRELLRSGNETQAEQILARIKADEAGLWREVQNKQQELKEVKQKLENLEKSL
jgi:hypothetical protein